MVNGILEKKHNEFYKKQQNFFDFLVYVISSNKISIVKRKE